MDINPADFNSRFLRVQGVGWSWPCPVRGGALHPAQDLAGQEIQEGATILSSLASQEEHAEPHVPVFKLYHSQLGKKPQLQRRRYFILFNFKKKHTLHKDRKIFIVASQPVGSHAKTYIAASGVPLSLMEKAMIYFTVQSSKTQINTQFSIVSDPALLTFFYTTLYWHEWWHTLWGNGYSDLTCSKGSC